MPICTVYDAWFQIKYSCAKHMMIYCSVSKLFPFFWSQQASSVIIKNVSSAQTEVPPKTLNEAGCMAVCYSVAWEAKVLSNAWWVYSHQVNIDMQNTYLIIRSSLCV